MLNDFPSSSSSLKARRRPRREQHHTTTGRPLKKHDLKNRIGRWWKVSYGSKRYQSILVWMAYSVLKQYSGLLITAAQLVIALEAAGMTFPYRSNEWCRIWMRTFGCKHIRRGIYSVPTEFSFIPERPMNWAPPRKKKEV